MLVSNDYLKKIEMNILEGNNDIDKKFFYNKFHNY